MKKFIVLLLLLIDNSNRNHGGGVEHRQENGGAKLYAILQALKNIPENSFTKVCICVNDTRSMHFVARGIKNLSENSYRSAKTGRLTKDFQVTSQLNDTIRSRTDLTIRVRYIPLNVHYAEGFIANNWANRLASELTTKAKQERSVRLLDLDLGQ